jgi:sulfhydrogenase subunit beta (sulfur reductase)
MNPVILKKKDMPKFIAAVTGTARLCAPVMRNGEVSLAELRPDDDIVFDYATFALPLKRLFFPQSETVAVSESGDLAAVPVPDRETVIFGARPCDVLSLVLLDNVFRDDEFVDPFYCRRREQSLIIALACSNPLETCFCTSVDSGPAAKEGADVLAFDLDDVLMFESVSSKGAAFVKKHSGLFSKPTPAQGKAQTDQEASTKKQMPVVDARQLNKKLQDVFDAEEWDTIAEACLSCGVCTFTCPTCHCFGLYDEKKCRIRAHDACMFPSFTLEASGHNPRTRKGDRMRQRIMHKFLYTVDNFGKVFCVGCGRCVAKCPVNIDVRETIEKIKTITD